jgi:hypothetical protein
MREKSRLVLSITRRIGAALFGVWLGVSCLFCCGTPANANTVASDAAGSAAQQAIAADDSCCHAHLKHQKGNNPARASTHKSAATRADASGVRFESGEVETCVSCSRQAADPARRARLLPAPACVPYREQTSASLPSERGGVRCESLVLNRSGTHMRCCVLLI